MSTKVTVRKSSKSDSGKSSRKEIGRIGQLRSGVHGHGSIFMEEFLSELQGVRGVQAYTEMMDNDSTVGGVWFAIEMLIRKTDFHIEPGGDSAKDKEAAEFVESCLNDMERTWAETLSEILSFLPFGWSFHEICYKRRMGKTSHRLTKSKYNDGLIGWRKLAPRAQDTLFGWEYADGTDDLIGMTQQPAPDYEKVTIPIEKALHFRTRSWKDNPEGQSIFRRAYRAWYIKKRLEEIEGYGMERDLAGLPVLYSPPDIDIFNPDDEMAIQQMRYAQELVSSIRRDSLEGVVLQGGTNENPGWKLELLASSGKRQFDTNQIIDRWDKRIATSVLADFVLLGQQQVGSFALADSKTKIFALAIGAYLDIICEVFNNQGIPRLIDMNGDHFKGIRDYPQMVHGDIEDVDLVQFTTFIKEMIGAGVLTPDEELEKEIRRIGNLPEKLETATPQGEPTEEEQTPGEETPESKSVYNVTSIMEKYVAGKATREASAELLRSIGLDDQKIDFYLSEADKSRAEQEKQKQEAEKLKAQNAAQKPGKGAKKPPKRKPEETPPDDEEDAKKAAEARKSLGRSE